MYASRLLLSVAALMLLAGASLRGFAASDVKADSLSRDKARDKGRLVESYGKVPLSFEPNRGQTDGRVQFLSRGPGYGIFLTPGEAVLSFQGKDKASGSSVMRMKLVGANASAAVAAEDKLPGTANYMRGTDRSKWATGVPTYGKVRYSEVYPGVDLVFYGNQRQLEYDFVVAPGRDAGRIALEFAGAAPKVDADGDLALAAGAKFHKPVVYQMLGGERVAVAGAYEVHGQRVGFRLGKYDHSKELVIDPVVTYLTYLGGSAGAIIGSITVDSSGAAYVTGSTSSADFPVKNAYQSNLPSGSTAMFVSKFNQSGTSLVYSTFLGSYSSGYAIKVDGSGSVYVVGVSADGFPVTSGAFQTICGGAHDSGGNRVSGCAKVPNFVQNTSGVLAKLSADGSSIVYATYLGGSNASEIGGVAVDQNGNAYVTGQTYSYCGPGPYSASTTEPFECFPTTSGAVQSGTFVPPPPQTQGSITDSYAFLTKFDATGSTLLYSSLLGPDPAGPNSEVYGTAVAVNTQGVAFMTGGTGFFPGNGGGNVYTTLGALEQTESPNGLSAFVAAFDTNSGELLYSTYLGGQNAPFDVAYGLAADSAGNAYVAGVTYDCDFPTTTGAFDVNAQYAPTDTANVGKCHTGFVAKLNPTGSALVWATYLGSAPLVTGTTALMEGLALGSDNSVYVSGQVQGTGFPVVNPVLPQQNTTQVLTVTHLSADGSSALFSSTVGGSSQTTDFAQGIAVDATGAIYVTGATQDPHFPTTNNALQPGFSGNTGGNTYNGFIAKISPSTPPTPNNGLTTNLLANPGAELGSIADWTPGGAGTPVVDSGTFAPGINPHTGSYDFVGGADVDSDSLSQTVSIIQQGITAAQVDGGTLFANVSFWEQGGDPGDEGSVTLTFLDANNAAIGNTVTIGPEDSHDGTWANVTGVPAIPVGTRSITYTMNFVRGEDSNTLAAFIDDNVLSIHTNTGLTIFPSTLHFGNVPVGQTSAAQTVSVTNQGTTGITIEQVASELGANPADFVQTNNCPTDPAVLAAGASCQITITFVPGGVGYKLAGVDLPDDTPPMDQYVRVDGTGTGGILQVNPGNLKTIAGTGVAGTTGNGGPATTAELNQPNGVAFDPSGNLYIADGPANVIRKVDTAGNISTFAGVGTGGFTGDGGPATQAELLDPASVTSDANGNIYIQDTLNFVIRKVTASTGIITTIAGTPQTPGHSGDGGPATAAKFNQNQGARFDSAGNFFVPTCRGASIRKIDTAGNISTVAGNFTEGYSGDGGLATNAQLQCPSGVAIDAVGNFYIADASNNVIRKVTAATGIISTIAGSTAGTPGATGDGGAATAALLNLPNDVAFDGAGNLYIADSANNRVRKIDTNGIITTAAGGLNNAGSAAVNTPLGLTTDASGNVYFSDSGNSAVREIFPQGVQPFPPTQVGTTSAAQTLTLSNIGNTDVTLSANGAFTKSGNAGDFTLSAGSCGNGTVLAANGGSCQVSITFTPTAVGQRTLTVMVADNALNTPQSFSIGGTGVAAALITPTITWAAPASIPYGTPLSGTQLNAVATGTGGVGVNGVYVYSPAAGTVLGAGEHSLGVTFTPTDAGYGPATGNTSITVMQFPPILTWPTPAPITTATPLSSTQLDAAATDINGVAVPGTYFYTPDAGSLLAAGTQQLTVTFVPNDTVDYVASDTTTRSIVVTQATTAATTTGLTVTAGGGPISEVAAGSVVTLTASVSAAQNSITPGRVAFCDASATTCTDNHLLATAQLIAGDTSSTATYKFVPGIGVHSYKAVFLGKTSLAGSASASEPLTVTGTYPTATTIAQSGTPGSYMLTATTVGIGDLAAAPTGTVSFLDSSNNNAVLATGPLGAGTAGLSFAGQSSASNFDSPQTRSVAADFNGDGILDLATANTTAGSPTIYANTVTISLGKGDGTFTTLDTRPTTGNRPQSLVAGDFNGDGKADLAVTNIGDGTVTILLGNGDGTFTAGTTVAVASNAYGLAATDFNGDGVLDIAVSDLNGVTILTGNGDGTFVTSQISLVSGTEAFGPIITADFNGDGKADLIVEGYSPDSQIVVLLGNGDGTFTTAAGVALPGSGSNQNNLVAGDFNGDGKVDFAATNSSQNTVLIMTGNGDGTFVTNAAASGTDYYPVDLVASDFDGDGTLDLGLAYGSFRQRVLLGNGDGTFTTPAITTGVFAFVGVTLGDFNGDGVPDLAGTDGSTNLEIALTQRTQTAVVAATPVAAGAGTHLVVARYPGDVNYSASVSSATSLTGAGAGTPVTPTLTWAMPAAITTATPLSAAQLDAVATDALGNGVPGAFVYTPEAGTLLAAGTQTLSVTFTPTDTTAFTVATTTTTIVVTQAIAATVTTLDLSSGGAVTATVAAGAVVTLTATVSAGTGLVNPGQVAFCDATAVICTDAHLLGTVQLVGTGAAAGTATYRFVPGIGAHSYKAVFLGTKVATGSASAAAALAVTGAYGTTTALAATGAQGSYALTATVNGFGAGSPTGSVVFTDTSTNATLGTVTVAGVVRSFVAGGAIAAGSGPNQVIAADVNGDGKQDLVLGNQSGAMVTVLIGNGDGTYTALPSFGTNYEGISGIAVADFNGDGKLDVATANGGTVGIFLGNGDGTFGEEQDFANTRNSQGVFAADFNGDGIIDLAVTDNNYGITILIGNGDGTFTQPNAVVATGNSPNFHLAVADLNGDGNLDIAVGNYSDNTVSVLLGNGDGTFQAQTTFAGGAGPRATFTGDFNGDGRPDILLTNGAGASVSVLLGNGDGTFQTQQTFAVGTNPYGASVGDLNGDGKPDMAVANQGDGTVSILYGNGDGTFQTQQVLTSGGGADGVVLGDVNGDGSPDLETANYSDSSVTVFLNHATAPISLTGVTLPGIGSDNVVATYGGDTEFTGSTSNTLTLPSNLVVTPVITWAPAVATIAYGTALGAQQLNATAATAAGVAIPGTFVYTPAAGTVLTAGTQTLSVAFTPTSANYSAAAGTATITVTQATPVITWAAPAGIAYGTALSATQLDATVTGVGAGPLAGTLVYTPSAGTVLAPGMQTLSVVFTPTDAVDYTTATASVPIVVGGLTLTSFTPVGVLLGSGDTTITLTGTGFVPTSVVMVNGAAVATAYVSPTMLTAVIPAALLRTMGSLAVTVVDPSIGAATVAQTFSVVPPTGAATLSGPATTNPGTQPTVTLAITNPYPLALTAQFSLAFASAGTTSVDDPSIQFSSGGRTFDYTVAANSTTVPPVELQAGTDAGTITITAKLMADGVDVTPAGLAPLVIVVPAVVPLISGTTITASGKTLTVVMHGFSNTREVSSAVFDFTAATGDVLATPSVTIPATTIFGTWYGDPASVAYGSTFTYTQTFNTSEDAKTIGSVKVTLTNSVGASAVSTSTGP